MRIHVRNIYYYTFRLTRQRNAYIAERNRFRWNSANFFGFWGLYLNEKTPQRVLSWAFFSSKALEIYTAIRDAPERIGGQREANVAWNKKSFPLQIHVYVVFIWENLCVRKSSTFVDLNSLLAEGGVFWRWRIGVTFALFYGSGMGRGGIKVVSRSQSNLVKISLLEFNPDLLLHSLLLKSNRD